MFKNIVVVSTAVRVYVFIGVQWQVHQQNISTQGSEYRAHITLNFTSNSVEELGLRDILLTYDRNQIVLEYSI